MLESGGELLQSLNQQFGGMRAEYFAEDLFEHFSRPVYWPELLTPRPCFLSGGRGTGKTTVLRGLSYQGQWFLEGEDPNAWSHVGLYWRVDTNLATAFRSGGVCEEQWIKLFSHYLNLEMVGEVVDFLNWREAMTGETAELSATDIEDVCLSLHLDPQGTVKDLGLALRRALIVFEGTINNIADLGATRLSMQGRPIRELLGALGRTRTYTGKQFYFLIDEYENLEDYQQRALNTLVKHSGDGNFTFKIGVRESGHRDAGTLNRGEYLVHPADFALVEIAKRLKDHDFSEFARRICEDRLSRACGAGPRLRVDELFPGLSMEAEAEKLGARARRRAVGDRLSREGANALQIRCFNELDNLQAAFLGFWADSRGVRCVDALEEFRLHPLMWSERLNNYGHAMLFTLRRGMRGIRKYYAGWETYVALADGNIRYLLQLVSDALIAHVLEGRDLAQPVSYEGQTSAARGVGERILQQLPGLATEGAQLTRIVLGLGRVFGVMAAEPEGHAPEVNQFRLDGRRDGEVTRLIDAAVMNLALVRFPGDKMARDSGETRDWNYQLHSVFSPYFVYSHRKKRRMKLASEELLGLTTDPARTIARILGRSNRRVDTPIPEQLTLFKEFYGDAPR